MACDVPLLFADGWTAAVEEEVDDGVAAADEDEDDEDAALILNPAEKPSNFVDAGLSEGLSLLCSQASWWAPASETPTSTSSAIGVHDTEVL